MYMDQESTQQNKLNPQHEKQDIFMVINETFFLKIIIECKK